MVLYNGWTHHDVDYHVLRNRQHNETIIFIMKIKLFQKSMYFGMPIIVCFMQENKCFFDNRVADK